MASANDDEVIEELEEVEKEEEEERQVTDVQGVSSHMSKNLSVSESSSTKVLDVRVQGLLSDSINPESEVIFISYTCLVILTILLHLHDT
jgi:hypothetical protein